MAVNHGQDASLEVVRKAFMDAHIPADISLTFDPSILLDVAFPQTTGPDIHLHAGIHLPRDATASSPHYSIRTSHLIEHRTLVIAMLDLDAPTPQSPTNAQVRHFLGGNFTPVPNLDLVDGRIALRSSTAAITEFFRPAPAAESNGPHRYIFLLFKQPSGFEHQTIVSSTTSIANFTISEFASEVGLGAPIGGTFMLVGPDPSTT